MHYKTILLILFLTIQLFAYANTNEITINEKQKFKKMYFQLLNNFIHIKNVEKNSNNLVFVKVDYNKYIISGEYTAGESVDFHINRANEKENHVFGLSIHIEDPLKKSMIKRFKNFSPNNPEIFLKPLQKILYNKEFHKENWKLIYMSENFSENNIDSKDYWYAYSFKSYNIVPEVRNTIKISKDNQLLGYSSGVIPEIISKKIDVSTEEASKRMKGYFNYAVNNLENNYIFHKKTIEENFIGVVYGVQNDISKDFCKKEETFFLDGNMNRGDKAILCYEMDFNVRGNFKGGGINNELYSFDFPRTEINWLIFKEIIYDEFTYTFKIWIDTEKGDLQGGFFYCNWRDKFYKDPNHFRQIKKCYFWEYYFEDFFNLFNLFV